MNRIKAILRTQGRTQEYLCRMMNKSTNTVSNWSTNKIQPSVDDLYTIANILDCKIADLLMEKDEIKMRKKRQENV